MTSRPDQSYLDALAKRGGARVQNSSLVRKKPLRRSSPPKNFRAKPVYDIEKGEYHASKAEYARWQALLLLEQAGEISDLERQPVVVLVERRGKARAISWRLDARYVEDGAVIHEDTKPRPFTPREQLLMRLWTHFGPGPLRIVERKGRGWAVKRMVVPENRATK